MKTTMPFVCALVAIFTFAGCAALQESDARQTERFLAAAGFQAKPVTVQQQAALAGLTPYKLQSRVNNGSVLYLYYDPSQSMVYVGGPAEYTNYQKLEVQQEMIAQQQMTALEMQTMNPWIMPTYAPMVGPAPHHR